MTTTTKPDYPYIRAWGAMMGSSSDYVDEVVAEARQHRAPATAIYQSCPSQDPERWRIYEEIVSAGTKAEVDRIMEERR